MISEKPMVLSDSSVDSLSYEQARDMAADSLPTVRLELAHRQDVPSEILYFLAGDAEVMVRVAIAANRMTPAKADLLLAEDPDKMVRLALAAKLSGQIVDRVALSPQARGITRKAFEHLLCDKVIEVRVVISETLKNTDHADPEIINRLARDAELLVCGPPLQFSPVLSDNDLLNIIAGNPVAGALAAIACRSYVAEEITEAIVASNDSHAITKMLRNGNAHLRENTLDSLIERAEHEPDWQEPLVYRPELNERSAQHLAEVVAAHLLNRILERKDLSEEAILSIAKIVGERLRTSSNTVEPLHDVLDHYAPLLEAAHEQQAKGQLDEMTVMVNLLAGHVEETQAELAVLTDLSIRAVLEIVASRSQRALCALSWAAGLSAGFSAELQIRLVGIPTEEILWPTDSGEYAMREEELKWQLAMFPET